MSEGAERFTFPRESRVESRRTIRAQEAVDMKPNQARCATRTPGVSMALSAGVLCALLCTNCAHFLNCCLFWKGATKRLTLTIPCIVSSIFLLCSCGHTQLCELAADGCARCRSRDHRQIHAAPTRIENHGACGRRARPAHALLQRNGDGPELWSKRPDRHGRRCAGRKPSWQREACPLTPLRARSRSAWRRRRRQTRGCRTA